MNLSFVFVHYITKYFFSHDLLLISSSIRYIVEKKVDISMYLNKLIANDLE